MAKDDERMVEAYEGTSERSTASRFGKALAKRAGRVYGGLKIVDDGPKQRVARYKLVYVAEQKCMSESNIHGDPFASAD